MTKNRFEKGVSGKRIQIVLLTSATPAVALRREAQEQTHWGRRYTRWPVSKCS